jgi:transcriptional regulator
MVCLILIYKAPIFQRYHFGDFTTEGLNVRSFYIGNQVKVIGTNEGLYYVDETRKMVKLIPKEQLLGAHIITNIFYYKGLFYIASYDGGLLMLNPQTFAISRIPNQPLLTTATIVSFDISRDGNLWIGTSEGIFVWDGEKVLARYTENNSRLGAGVTNLHFDCKGNGWACSQGISLYVAATQTFENSHFPNGFFNSETGLGCVRGHQGLMFFPKQTQIFYTNPSMTQFGQLEMPGEFVGSKCYGFLDDMRGHYWIATDQGLYRLNYQMQDLQHFGYGEGLMCQFINSEGIRMDAKGGIWVATSNGLMEVNRQALESWLHHNPYHIALYDIRRGSDLMEYALEDHANDEHTISIHWNILSEKLSFRILLQDYARPYGRLYQYKMEGDKEWRSVSDGKDVEMINLLPGMHELKVRLAGAPATERTYQITVLPSWLAILELIILIAALVLLLMWRNYHKNTKALLNERNEIEGALMEIEQENVEMEVQQDLENEAMENKTLESDVEETMGKATSQKYARVKVDEKEFSIIVERMKAYIEEKRCYTNQELKMSDLAEVLGLSSSKLSQVFSLYVKENYYEFINRYRLEEFKRLISEGEYKKYTLTALSEKCGFKKSSFFSTFRRVEGMTPTEYLKAQNIKI